MHVQWRFGVSGLILLLLLAGCDDPNAASAENFEKALQRYYDASPVCVTLALVLPLESSADLDDVTHRQLDTLAKLGLLSTTASRTDGPTQTGSGKTSNDVGYTLTAAGEKVIRKGGDKFLGGTDICFAHRRVTMVESFTAPTDRMGMTISRVTYEYDPKDVEAWATDRQTQDVFPQIKIALTKPVVTAVEGLVLTNEGWEHEAAFR